MAFPTPRTTSVLVAGIVDADPDIDLTPFIETANGIVTKYCALSAYGYTDDQLEMIERWLSAHFYSIRDPRVRSEGAKGISAGYVVEVAPTPFKSTPYGMSALAADFMGGLAALDKRLASGTPRPGISYLGKSCPPGGTWW